MTRQILTVFLVMVTLSVVGQDTIIDKTGRKLPVYITNLTAEKVTFIAANDSTGKETTLFRKYLNGVIRNEAPAGSNLITCISPNKKELPLFITFGRVLKSHGFIFDKVDKDFLILETKMTKIEKSYNIKITISVNENRVLIRSYGVGDMKGLGLWGFGSVNQRNNYNYRGVKKKRSSLYSAFAFDYADNLAKEFKRKYGCKIIYSKE